MPKSTPRAVRCCPHLLPIELPCPACAGDQHDAWLAGQIAARDPQTVESLRIEFEQWLAQDPPAHRPEVY